MGEEKSRMRKRRIKKLGRRRIKEEKEEEPESSAKIPDRIRE